MRVLKIEKKILTFLLQKYKMFLKIIIYKIIYFISFICIYEYNIKESKGVMFMYQDWMKNMPIIVSTQNKGNKNK